jgi:hypothetical protein
MSGPGGEATVEPDGVVRTALQMLPIPAHDHDFWGRLEVALHAEPRHVAPAEPLPEVVVAGPRPGAAAQPSAPVRELDAALAVVPLAFRRPSNVLLGLVATAAVVVVAIAGTSLMAERDGTSVSEPEADAALETLVRNAQANGTVTSLSADREDESSEAVLAWVADLGSGDADGAWEAMGPVSQAHFGSQAEFEGSMSDLVEGYGPSSAAQPERVLVTPVAAADDATIAVVTLIGDARADAFPVRIEDGDVKVEPFASAGDLEVVIPEASSDDALSWESVGTGEELVFVLPGDAEAPVLQVDGGDTVVCGEAQGTELGDLDQSSGQRCAYLPEGGFEAGAHTLTIAFLGPDGDSVTAESIQFEAA